MERKIVKLFLASSITDLKEDRLYLGDFFNTLNNIYENRDLFFKLIKCETYDNSIALEGKQAQYDAEICDSELCFFLFFKKVGDYTRHEFEVAMESFRATHKPKVVTYIKYVNSLDEVQQDVKAFMGELETNLKHYYSVYDHIDTLKLQMLLQIQNLGLDSSVLDMKNGEFLLNGKTVTTCEHVPMFAGNAEYGALQAEYQQVNEEYVTLKAQFLLDGENEAVEAAYFKIANKRATQKEQLETKEKELLAYAQALAEKSGAENLTARQINGYRLVEQGKYDEALKILDKADIFWEIDRDLQALQQLDSARQVVLQGLQQKVNELMQRIEVLQAQSVTPEVIADIYETFEKVYDITVTQNLDKEVLYGYAVFLAEQNNYSKAIAVGECYLNCCDDQSDLAKPEEYAGIYHLLACLYHSTNHPKKSEEYYLKAIELCEDLCQINPQAYRADLARIYSIFAGFYRSINNKKKAAIYYKKAKEFEKDTY